MAEIITANTTDKENIIDFINYVFSVAYTAHDFKKKVPKVYSENARDDAANHYVIKENGKIKALVSERRIDVKVIDSTLKYGLIGNVAVHPYSRNQGFMTELMNSAIEKAKNSGADIMVLTGNRQRYGYFGFNAAGHLISYSINKNNIKHCLSNIDCSDISFLPIQNASETEKTTIRKLYERYPIHAIRPEDEYLNIMSSWEEETLLVFKGTKLLGYIYGPLREVVLEDEELLYPVIKAYFERSDKEKLDFNVKPFEKRRIELLNRICESKSITSVALIKVLNWENVLSAFLKLKSSFTHLSDTEKTIKIDDEVIKITVKSGVADVKKADPKDTPSLFLDQMSAIDLLFGIDNLVIPNEETKAISALPFIIDVPDKF